MNIKRWAITIAASLTGILALAAIKGTQISQDMAMAEAMPEHSESTAADYGRRAAYTEYVTVLGDVVAPQSVELYSESAGRIVSVGFSSGAMVGAGDVLIQQDISEEQALLDAAQARRELAQSVYRRHQELYKTNAVSEEQYDRSRVELATVKADIARLESVIRKRTITAPFTGRVGIHQFEQGQFLLDNVLVTQLVGEQDHLWIDFHLPQFYPVLATGSTVDAGTINNGGDNSWVSAEIVARSTQVDSDNRSYQYRARVDRSAFPAGINSGVNVRIPIGESIAAIAVPATAVQHDRQGQFVYLLQEDENSDAYRAQRQGVTVLARRDGLAYLSQGLAEGQLVATDGAFKLYPGLLVHSGRSNAVDTVNTASALAAGEQESS